MAVTLVRDEPPHAIQNEAEYRAALARIEQLAPLEDLEAAGEMEAWANYVESYEEKRQLQTVQRAS
jgi:hypothetical protein